MTSTNSDYTHALANLKDTTAEEERVEVNQRALIDKILARYASANAVYRELLQNSNDAEATIAEIYFTTSAEQESDVIMDDSSSRKINKGTKFGRREIVRQGIICIEGFECHFAKVPILPNCVSSCSVEYRNNGLPFRKQDWSRLKKIAEGNPDER